MRYLAFAVVLCVTVPAQAEMAKVVGGKTNIDLDDTVLGALGASYVGSEGSVDFAEGYTVAFPISPRDAIPPTTFTYDAVAFEPFSGQVEHTGSMTLAIGPVGQQTEVVVGNFSVMFDASRFVENVKSGFYVKDNVSLLVPLFDLGPPSLLEPAVDGAQVKARLLITSELETALGADEGEIAGIDVGEVYVQAQAVPEPSTALLGLLGAGAIAVLLRRRRNS